MSNSSSEKSSTKVTLNENALEFLEEQYPMSMSNAERIRDAINDAKKYHDLMDDLELADR